MAPFKLKFRMGSGSSRSTSQEQDVVVDSQSNPVGTLLLNSASANDFGSSTTTLDSEQNNDSLVSMSNDRRALILTSNTTDEPILGYDNPSLTNTESTNVIPLSPPPSYEHVLEENRLAALDKENNRTSILNLSPTALGYEMMSNNQSSQEQLAPAGSEAQGSPGATRKQESIDSSLYTCSSTTTPSQENLLTCTGSCDPLYQLSCNEGLQDLAEEMETMAMDETCLSNENQDTLSLDEECSSYSNSQPIYEQQHAPPKPEVKGPEILYKSSKQLYKAVAKECGITCKMSDQCRCLDCQSRYFDCEYDQNENEKTDGGLGAGTPMFISEVMHGTACTIL
ncbi:AGAP004968-PA-like protein [Anopheles sinensis]|uniref:AGAP004968-PA-like protein n=1 Tax=Anopheles sinensis TaxID=74873 RepID=A0A084WDZ6_ANOSI|nr:AGAP004968-PA-like protein [Anopheles sinensis]